MRTTVNIDEHLLAEAKVVAAREQRSLGELIDDALRAALNRRAAPRRDVRLLTAGHAGRSPLVDVLDKEALAEVSGDNDWPHAAR